MHLDTNLAAIHHNRHVRSYYSRYVCCLCGIDNLAHCLHIFVVNNGIYRQISLNAMYFARFGYFVKVVDIKVIGTVRTHIQLPYAKVN